MRKIDYFFIMFLVLAITLGVMGLSPNQGGRGRTPMLFRLLDLFLPGTAVQEQNTYQQAYVSHEPIIRATNSEGVPQIDHSYGW